MGIAAVRDTRRKVFAWLGPPFSSVATKAVFKSRGLDLLDFSDIGQLSIPAVISPLAGAILTTNPNKPGAIGRILKAVAPQLLNYGCDVFVLADLTERDRLTMYLNQQRLVCSGTFLNREAVWNLKGTAGEPASPAVRVFAKDTRWREILNTLDPLATPPVSMELKIECTRLEKEQSSRLKSVENEYGVLVRRAFFDCSKVHLFPLDGGRSGASVFRAYAHSQLSPWPRPLFVKIDARDEVLREYESYIERVHPFIPFHLGPQLRLARCNLGSALGILVGDYVQDSESFVQAAREGRAPAALSCLFDRTLDNWYRDPSESKNAITSFVKLPTNINPGRMEAAKRLGAKLSLDELRQLFEKFNTSSPVLVAKIHGDLHVENIRMRQSDAIVIDFKASREGLILQDIARLEVSLLVDGLIDIGSSRFSISKWLKSVSRLYGRKYSISPPHESLHDPCAWFFACVRQLRMFARRAERKDGQYRAALIAALLDKAKRDPSEKAGRAKRLAAAYVLAERTLKAA